MLSAVLSPSVSLFLWPSQALAPPLRHSVAVPSGASRTRRTTERRQMRGAGMTMSMRMLMEMTKKIRHQVEGSLPFHAGRYRSSSQEASGHRSVQSPSSPPCHHLRRRRSLSPIPVLSHRRKSLSPIPVPSQSQRFTNAPLCLNLLLSQGSRPTRGRREMREPPATPERTGRQITRPTRVGRPTRLGRATRSGQETPGHRHPLPTRHIGVSPWTVVWAGNKARERR